MVLLVCLCDDDAEFVDSLRSGIVGLHARLRLVQSQVAHGLIMTSSWRLLGPQETLGRNAPEVLTSLTFDFRP